MTRERSDAEEDADLKRAAIGQLKANLDVRRVARTYVLAVDYTSPDRGKAAAIANAFADAYLTDQFDAKFDATRRAAGWLQSRIAELKQQSLDFRFRHPEVQGRQGHCRHGRRPARTYVRSATDRTQRAAGGCARRHGESRSALRANPGLIEVGSRRRVAFPILSPIRSSPICREKYLNASKVEAQLESKLGGGHLQVINLRREMEEFQRLIYEELQRIAESYRSDAEVARAKEQSLTLSMSGLVGASAGTNQTLVQLRELEREAETYRALYQTFMQRYQEALQQQSFPVSEARVITSATPPAISELPQARARSWRCRS